MEPCGEEVVTLGRFVSIHNRAGGRFWQKCGGGRLILESEEEKTMTNAVECLIAVRGGCRCGCDCAQQQQQVCGLVIFEKHIQLRRLAADVAGVISDVTFTPPRNPAFIR
jgi:hypothetical protein